MLEQFVIIYPVLSCYILIIEQLFAKYLEESDILKKSVFLILAGLNIVFKDGKRAMYFGYSTSL